MNGVVKFYNRKKGFGYVTGEDGKDYFLVYPNIGNNVLKHPDKKVRKLYPGTKMRFEVRSEDKGPVAVNIEV